MKKTTILIICAVVLVIFGLKTYSNQYKRSYTNGSLEVKQTGDGYTTLSTPKVALPKGDYFVRVTYYSDVDSTVSLVSRDNTAKIVGENLLEQGGGYLMEYFDLSFSEDTYDFSFRITTENAEKLTIDRITIFSQVAVGYDWTYLFVLVILILLAIIYFTFKREPILYPGRLKEDRALVGLILIALVVFASYPLFSNIMMEGHDLIFHLNRIEGIKAGILDGQFPVKIYPNAFRGYGDIVSVYYPELFLYIPAVLRLMGMSVTAAHHLFLIMVNIATVLVAYFSFHRMSKSRLIAVVATALYSLSVYRLVNIYIRFATGEFLAMIFLPLLLYGLYEIVFGDPHKWWYLVIAATGILQSHILTTMICVFFTGIGMLCFFKVFLKDRKRIIALGKAIGLILLLNLWFLVPLATLAMETTNAEGLTRILSISALPASQIFQVFPMSSFGLDSIYKNAPYMIGFVMVISNFVFVGYLYKNRKEENDLRKISFIFFLLGLLSVLMATQLFPYDFIERFYKASAAVGIIQFTWRFLAIATTCLAFTGAVGVDFLGKEIGARRLVAIATCGMCIITAGFLMDSAQKESKIYLTQGELLNDTNPSPDYLYKGTDVKTLKKDQVTASSEDITIDFFEKNGTKMELFYQSSSDTEGEYVELPALYFKGYRAKDGNGNVLETDFGENNVLKVLLPKEDEGTILISYVGLTSWKIANGITLVTVMVIIGLAIKRKRNRKEQT